MNKPKKTSAKSVASSTKLSFSFPEDRNSDWDLPEIHIDLLKEESEGSGGWRAGRREGMVFYATIDHESSCCGFPVLTEMSADAKLALKHREEIGKRFNEWLESHMVYLSAYVPETKEYAGVRTILEATGLRPGVSLRTSHGTKYHNVRWEWNAAKHLSTNLSRGTSAKNLRTLNI